MAKFVVAVYDQNKNNLKQEVYSTPVARTEVAAVLLWLKANDEEFHHYILEEWEYHVLTFSTLQEIICDSYIVSVTTIG